MRKQRNIFARLIAKWKAKKYLRNRVVNPPIILPPLKKMPNPPVVLAPSQADIDEVEMFGE